MARKLSQVAQLRATVEAQHKSAMGKMNRLKKNKGVNIHGSQFDVTRDPTRIKTYNTAQLKKYSEELSMFNDRGRQYVAGAKGQPLPKGMLTQYKKIEGSYNSGVNNSFDAVKDTKLPSQDGTLADRMAEMMPTRMNRAAQPVNAAYRPPVRNASGINGVKALQTLMDDYKKRSDPAYKQQQLDTDRASLIKTLRDAGMDARNSSPDYDVDLISMVYDLTDKQFATVWQYTNLAGAAFLNYESLNSEATGVGEPLTAKQSDDTLFEVRELLKWAKYL